MPPLVPPPLWPSQMIVNITCDHRVVYGAHAAEFLQVRAQPFLSEFLLASASLPPFALPRRARSPALVYVLCAPCAALSRMRLPALRCRPPRPRTASPGWARLRFALSQLSCTRAPPLLFPVGPEKRDRIARSSRLLSQLMAPLTTDGRLPPRLSIPGALSPACWAATAAAPCPCALLFRCALLFAAPHPRCIHACIPGLVCLPGFASLFRGAPSLLISFGLTIAPAGSRTVLAPS